MNISVEDVPDGVEVCVAEGRGKQYFLYRRDTTGTLEESKSFSAVGFIPSATEEADARKNARIELAKREAIITVM